MDEDEILDGRITILVPEPTGGYDYNEDVGAAAPDLALEKLGTIEDMIERGELMTPSVKPGDDVFFVYKQTQVIQGVFKNAFTKYDYTAETYLFFAELRSDFYEMTAIYPASEYGQTWFKTQAEAEAALQEILEAEEEENVGNNPE